jgi:hypothetical protein
MHRGLIYAQGTESGELILSTRTVRRQGGSIPALLRWRKTLNGSYQERIRYAFALTFLVFTSKVIQRCSHITGAVTSIAAFVGYTARGLDNRATEIFSFADFERSFGGLAADSELSFAVQRPKRRQQSCVCRRAEPKLRR